MPTATRWRANALAQAGGDHRQGHAHLQLHVRGRAGGRAGRGGRRRAADGADAHPGRRAPDALAARRRRHRDFGLAQPAPRQRHQVLLGRTARSSTTPPSWRSRPRWTQPFRTVAVRAAWARRVRTRDAIGRYVEACKNAVPRGFDLGGMRIAMDCANGATYQIGPLVLRELGARVDAIGVEPNGTQHQRRRGLDPSRIPRRARARDRGGSRHRLRWRRRPRAVRRCRRYRLRWRRPAVRAGHRLASRAAACAARWSAR